MDFTALKDFMDHLTSWRIPGNGVMVCLEGKEAFSYTSGYADVENRIPMTLDHYINIYSCSKVTTVTSALQLYEQGAFQLDDPLYAFIPEYKEMYISDQTGLRKAEKPITLRNLFTMTAGFTYNLRSPWLLQLREDTDGRCPTREVARYLAREPLAFHPGERYQYSLCHDVLAALVEVIAGEKFEDYVRGHIFEPMGMKNSNFLLDPERYDEVVATHYAFKDGAPQKCSKWPAYRLGTEHASGGAGCVSTVEDYIKFAEGLRTYRLLKPETIEYMTRDWLLGEAAGTFPIKSFHYGLGIRRRDPGTDLMDFGWGGAAGAHLAVDIPHGISLYYSQHLLSSPNHSVRGRVYSAVLEDLGYNVVTEMPPDPENLTY